MWLLYFHQRNEIYRDTFHSLNIVKNLFLYISVYILILYISLSIPKMLKLCLFAHYQFKKIKKKERKRENKRRRKAKENSISRIVYTRLSSRLTRSRKSSEGWKRERTRGQKRKSMDFYFSRVLAGSESVACRVCEYSRVPSKRELLIPLHPHLDSGVLAGRQ